MLACTVDGVLVGIERLGSYALVKFTVTFPTLTCIQLLIQQRCQLVRVLAKFNYLVLTAQKRYFRVSK